MVMCKPIKRPSLFLARGPYNFVWLHLRVYRVGTRCCFKFDV